MRNAHNSTLEVQMSGRSNVGGGTRLRAVLASLGLLAALFLLAPRELHGEGDWKECVDGAFLDYNDCLMESSSWFNQALCDFNFEFEVALCTAYIVGDIKEAYEEGSPD